MIEIVSKAVYAFWPLMALYGVLCPYKLWTEREAWRRLPQVATSATALGVHAVGVILCAWLLVRLRSEGPNMDIMGLYLFAIGLLFGAAIWVQMIAERRELYPRRG